MRFGNMPNDGGHLLLDATEAASCYKRISRRTGNVHSPFCRL